MENIVPTIAGVIFIVVTVLVIFYGGKAVHWFLDHTLLEKIEILVVGGIIIPLLMTYGVNFLFNDLYATVLSQLQQTKFAHDVEGALSGIVGIVGVKMEEGWLTSATIGQKQETATAEQVYGGAPPSETTQQAQAAPTATTIPGVAMKLWEDDRALAVCIKYALAQTLINPNTKGSTEWFPIGTRWTLERKTGLGILSKNTYLVRSDSPIIVMPVNHSIGGSLWEAAKGNDGVFEGSATQWPSVCYQNWAPPAGSPDPMAEFRTEANTPPADSTSSTTNTATPPDDTSSTTNTATPPADTSSTTNTATPPADTSSTTITECPANGTTVTSPPWENEYIVVVINGAGQDATKHALFGSPTFTGESIVYGGETLCVVTMKGATYPVAIAKQLQQ